MKFSVLMPVHNGIKFSELENSLRSILNNSIKFDDFVIIVDGIVDKKKKNLFFKLKNNKRIKIYYKKKTSLSKILNFGLKKTKNDLVFRCDADDENSKKRFEEQLKFFKNNKLDILGSNLCENFEGKKLVKIMPKYIFLINLIFRNPINHMTVIYNKKKILKIGGYPEIPFMEDYALWLMSFMNQLKIGNIQKTLVYSNLDINTFKRRRNLKTIQSEFQLLFFLMKNNFLLSLIFVIPITLRILSKILPLDMFKFLYIFLRKNNV